MPFNRGKAADVLRLGLLRPQRLAVGRESSTSPQALGDEAEALRSLRSKNEAKRLEPADCGFSMPGFREPGTRDVVQDVVA